MPTYYVDPAATGLNDGSSWENAWTSINSALALSAVAAGDTVYCRGSQTLSSVPTNQNAGSLSGGFIKFIGCNASGVNDGTYFVLNANSAVANAWNNNAKSYIWLENLELKNATSHGWTRGASSYWGKCVFVNVYSHDNGDNGFECYYSQVSDAPVVWFRCKANNNGGSGFYDNYSGFFVWYGCEAIGNSSSGINCRGNTSFLGVMEHCLLHQNTGNQVVSGSSSTAFVSGSVIDGGLNNGISTTNGLCLVIGGRITNHSVATKLGLESLTSAKYLIAASYLGGNTTDITAGSYEILTINGSTSDMTFGGTDSDHGYTDSANDNFNLAPGATGRSIAIPLDFSQFSPRKLRPSLYLSADRSVYQDAAVQFTAADKSWLQIAQGQYSTLAPRTGDLLVCGWWRIDSLPERYGTLLLMGTSGTGNGGKLYVYSLNSGKVYVEFSDGIASISLHSDSAVFTAEQWCFVAIHLDRDGNLTQYANGISVGSADISSYQGDMTFAKGQFRIGGATHEPYLHDHRTDSLMFFKKADLSAVVADIIAWAYNSGQGRLCAEITDEQKAAWGAVSGWEFAEASGTRYDSWGTNHLDQQFGEILTNGGFEDYTGTLDDGQTDSFTDWTKFGAAGGIIEATATAHSGGVALKITNINGVSRIDLQRRIPVVPGATYTLSMYVRGDGTNPPWYRIINDTGSTPVISTTTTGITGTSYQLFTKTFTAPADCTAIYLRLHGTPNEAGSVVYFDDVSLKRESILRAPGIVRAIAANGDGVSYWQDQSTGGKHAAQITLAKRPTLVTSGINSRPVIRGDGVDDYLGVSELSLEGAFTISAVFQSEANPSALTLLGKDANNYITLTDNTTVTVGIAGASQAFTVSAMGTDPHILTVTRDADNAVNVYLDGTVSTTGAKTVAGTLALEQIMANAGGYFAGDLAEVLVYDGAKGTAELTQIHTYLAGRYGVTL